jgi:uncharacterized membrane protein
VEDNLRETRNFLPGEGSGKFSRSLASLLRNPVVLFGVAFLISAICKLSALNSRELWLDETYSAFMGNLPLAQILHHTAGDVHPPFYYLLLWVWIRVIGDAQAQLRLFGVVLSICASLGMFFVSRRLLGRRFGAYAAALFAFSPMLFVYSLEVRMYMLVILIFVCLLLVHWAVAVEQREAKWLVAGYSLLAALLLYVHYIGIFILLGLFAHWAISAARARRGVARLCAAAMLTLLLISPGIPVLLKQHSGKAQLDQALRDSYSDSYALTFGAAGHELTRAEEIKTLAKNAAAMAGFYPSASPVVLLLCAIPLALALAAVGFLALVKGDKVCGLFLVMLLAVAVGVFSLRLYSTRFMLPLVPLLVIAIARGVQWGAERSRWRIPSLAVGTLILCLYAAAFFRQTTVTHGHPWQNLMDVMRQDYRPGEPVVFDALYAQVPFDYFAGQAHFQPQETGFPLSIYDWWQSQGFKGWGGPVILRSDLDRFVSGLAASRPKTVWLVLFETSYYDPRNELLEKLRLLGQVTEIPLPADPDTRGSQENSPLRLFRVAMN